MSSCRMDNGLVVVVVVDPVSGSVPLHNSEEVTDPVLVDFRSRDRVRMNIPYQRIFAPFVYRH